MWAWCVLVIRFSLGESPPPGSSVPLSGWGALALISSGFTSLTWSQYQKVCQWNNINNNVNNYLLSLYYVSDTTLLS